MKRLVIEAQDQDKPYGVTTKKPRPIIECNEWVVYHNIGPTLDEDKFGHLWGDYQLDQPDSPQERLELVQMIALQTWHDAHIELIGGIGAIGAVMQAVADYQRFNSLQQVSGGDDEG